MPVGTKLTVVSIEDHFGGRVPLMQTKEPDDIMWGVLQPGTVVTTSDTPKIVVLPPTVDWPVGKPKKILPHGPAGTTSIVVPIKSPGKNYPDGLWVPAPFLVL